MEHKPIFFDAQQKRWRRTRLLLETSGALVTVLLFVFFLSVLQRPDLPGLLLPETRPVLHAVQNKDRRRPVRPAATRRGRRGKVAALGQPKPNYDPLRAAFYVSWDFTSLVSLQQHYRDIDLLIPEALHAISPDGHVDVESDPNLLRWMQSLPVPIPSMALVNNFDGAAWRSRELGELLANPESRRRLAADLLRCALTTHQVGIVVDFEEVPRKRQKEFRELIQLLAADLHRVNQKLMVALPAADPEYDYPRIATYADAIILMDYDFHWVTSSPGPIAPQDWFVRNLETVLQHVPPQRVVIAIAGYGYDWTERERGRPARPAASLSFQQAIVTARESEASVKFDPDSLNPQFSYSDEFNRTHRVWMLDAVTAYNQLRAAEAMGVRGSALWRLGSEDPSLWFVWDTLRPGDGVRAKLQQVPPGYDLVLEGEGDLWRITATPEEGRRAFRYDAASDLIVDESYPVPPMPYRIDQLGGGSRRIALSFDDGPDPRFTPAILDVLKEKRAPATFFVTGIAASDYPSILRRIYAEGHEIGNHTYTHPRFDDISARQLQIEVSLTELLLEGELGVRSMLFRPPYGVDHQPESADEVKMLPEVQQMGYVIVGSRIDPHDWGEPGGLPPPPADVIAARVLDQAKSRKGNVVLLHDGGGGRSNTVAALPRMIDGLRAAGFQLLPVSGLIGQTRAQVMPPVQGRERWLARASEFVFRLYHLLRLWIVAIFLAGIGLVTSRALIIGLLAVIEKLRRQPAEQPGFRPLVSVLIPAYNEEEAIVETVSAALASDYPHFEVIVVDDGSWDRTAELVRQHFGHLPPVCLLRQPNRGKPAALNLGLARARGEVIVTIDADTAIGSRAISKLVRHFADARVGAVAGNTKVANRNRWLTRWQALEYITSQNLEKRAFDLLNCITVVPGAVGAWRAETLRAAGGFSHDTLAEDTDLTLTIRRAGWRVRYDDEAIGNTHAPETAGALVRQRFRWTFGTLQAVWKHLDAVGRRRHGTLGWVALPNIFIFQILLPLVSPVIDLLFLASLALWALAQFHVAHVPQLWTVQDVERSLVFLATFMVIDFLTCVIAFALEKQEDYALLAPLLLQRFYYRQMMYMVIFRSVLRAVQGQTVGWGGVEPPETQVPATA